MENAIIMAAGMGSRMRPLTENIPKPLIDINGIPMIETVINGLNKRNISNIVIVTGYLGDQFEYLTKMYSNITMLKNERFQTENNISSMFEARDFLLNGNCFICEADLFVSDSSIFEKKIKKSCYYGKMVRGYSSDWVFEQNKEGYITSVGKGGTDCYNMTGIAYFMESDAKKLHDYIEKDYEKKENKDLFWDDIVNNHIEDFKLVVNPVESHQIIEIDTVDELLVVRNRFKG